MNDSAANQGKSHIVADQGEVEAFLADPASYDPPVDGVKRIDTHCATVFLAGPHAYKIKKAVRFPFLDFSTLERRRAVCRRELEINAPHAPAIYLDVVPITREKSGALAIGGKGEAIEWAVKMRRFAQDAILGAVADNNKLTDRLVDRLAGVIVAMHIKAKPVAAYDFHAGLARLIGENAEGLGDSPQLFARHRVAALTKSSRQCLKAAAPLLAQRARDGFVRRCHGDLHLGNIVLTGGSPVPFDAIEFSEDVATVDVLDDLAFLIMDLWTRGLQGKASRLLNRYLEAMADSRHLDALAALPLYLSTRAAIRAKVTALAAKTPDDAAGTKALRFFDAAEQFISPPPASLVAIGGLSGTGKSTLARRLAPFTGPPPGAVHLKSDHERKTFFGVDEHVRLGPAGYSQDVTRKIYAILERKARRALAAGHGVILDAVQARPIERAAAEALAKELGVPFTGLWLQAPASVLLSRVEARHGDVSDATPDVVQRQLGYETGDIDWTRIDAAPGIETILKAARKALTGEQA